MSNVVVLCKRGRNRWFVSDAAARHLGKIFQVVKPTFLLIQYMVFNLFLYYHIVRSMLEREEKGTRQ